MKVLIGVGPARASEKVVEEAASRPWPNGTSFLLATLIDPFPFVKASILLENACRSARQRLESLSEKLHQTWETESDVTLGNPHRRIGAIAGEWKADLVMLGAQEVADITRFILGSTAQSALRHAPCSVEIVRPRPSEAESRRDGGIRILIATDGSEFSLRALRSVRDRPWPQGSTAKIISVPELILPLREFPYFEPHEVEDLNIASMEEAKAAVAAGVTIFTGSALKVCSEVPMLQDLPWRVILCEGEKWNADMIVVGSHGRKGFDRWTMGSVSEAVALHAKCSVEVIRERMAQT